MNFLKYIQSLIEWVSQLNNSVKHALPEAKMAIRKPATFGYILLTAYKAQLALFVLLLFLIFLAPPTVDFITGIIFPPETSKILGLIKTQQENPWREAFSAVTLVVLWIVSMSSVFLLVLLHVPNGLKRANLRAQKLKDKADSKAVQPISLQEKLPTHSTLNERYKFEEELGKGAMGVVYRAWDQVLDRKVAIKQLSVVLSMDEEFASRFRREAKALARLTHPNIVQVFDLVEDGNKLWMVLECVEGGDLSSYLKEKKRLAENEAVDFVIAVAEGLGYAHAQGIVHRDLKPANILLSRELIPKISDFGIAKVSKSSKLTQSGWALGSPPYMSPEQCKGETVDERTDIYALGITLYELLTGKVPFDGDTASVLARQITEPPKPLSELVDEISDDLEAMVSRMLAKDPEERPSSMKEVTKSLTVLIGNVAPQGISSLVK
jgi:tRNA A-37 threonylcarbamoyl transferase component Bud32